MAKHPKTKSKGTKSKSKPKKRPALSPVASSRAEDARYRAEEDVRTLQRAEEIKVDKRRISAARTMAAKQAKALNKVAR